MERFNIVGKRSSAIAMIKDVDQKYFPEENMKMEGLDFIKNSRIKKIYKIKDKIYKIKDSEMLKYLYHADDFIYNFIILLQ